MNTARRGRRQLLGLACFVFCPDLLWAQGSDDADESHVKAAFLYKFTSYVDWPDSAFGNADAPFVIGVMGSDTMLETLLQLTAGRKVHERAVVVKKVQAGEPMLGNLHVLFVGRPDALRAEITRPVLTVTEADGGMPAGSMINFLVVDRHVRFEIELPSVEKAGLKMSSRLLAVAQKVYRSKER